MDGLTIKHCFVFNPSLKSPKKKPSDDEAQDAKLLFYYPTTEELLVKRSNFGIIEGTLSFMNSFEQTKTSFLLTELNKFYFVANNYENDFIICFILEKKSPMFSYYQNVESKKKWLKKLLDNFYNIFTFFHHSFTKFFINPENPTIHPELSEEKLASFEDYVVNFIEYFSKGQKLPFLDNVVYFPLSEHVQSDILLAIQRLNEKIPEMSMSSIIYKGNIIHNQIPLNSFSLLFNIFYNVFEYTPKFNTFNKAPYQVVPAYNLNVPASNSKAAGKTEESKKEVPGPSKEAPVNEGSQLANPSNSNPSQTECKVSPFRKAFDLNISNNEFLIGFRQANANNYHIFVPTVHIRQMDESFKLLAYYYKGMIIFMFLNDKFNAALKLNSILLKFDKWIEKYFKDLIPYLEDIYKRKTAQNDLVNYAYCNNANKSLKLSSQFFNKKNKTIEPDKLDMLQRMFLVNSDVQLTSLTKIKGSYFYYLNSCERNVMMIYNDNLSLKELKKNIDENKKELFDSVYII